MTPIQFQHGAEEFIVARAHSQDDWPSLAIVASTLYKAAHAYAHGRGLTFDDSASWVVVAPGAVATMAHPQQYFLDGEDGCTPERAALLAHRVHRAMRSTGSTVSDEELDDPFAFVAAPGVPVAEMRALCAFSLLALQAAGELAGPVAAQSAPAICATFESGVTPDGAGTGLVATRLDHPDALELETRHALCAAAATLIDGHPGLTDWLPRDRDPTVRVRTPAGAPGVPLVFAPFIIASEAARRALKDTDLVDRALAQCAPHAGAPTRMH